MLKYDFKQRLEQFLLNDHMKGRHWHSQELARRITDYLERAGLITFEYPEDDSAVTAAIETIDENCGSEAECATNSFGYKKFCEYEEHKDKVMNKVVSTLLNVSIEDKGTADKNSS